MAFTLVIDPMALRDVQDAIDYYDDQQAGLGKGFEMFFGHILPNTRIIPSGTFPQKFYYALTRP